MEGSECVGAEASIGRERVIEIGEHAARASQRFPWEIGQGFHRRGTSDELVSLVAVKPDMRSSSAAGWSSTMYNPRW